MNQKNKNDMKTFHPIKQHRLTRRWRMLLIYNIYRLINIILFWAIFLYHSPAYILPFAYYVLLGFYFFCGLVFFYLWLKRIVGFEFQVLLSGTVDVLVIACLLTILGVIQSGFGILLNVIIAALSILVPGRRAIYFAALASCILLFGSMIEYVNTPQKELETFFYSGIYGAGFFATALTAWYLANWVRVSETLAQHRSHELAGLQRINEYIVERLHSGIIYVDINRHIKLINSSAKEFFNIPSEKDIRMLKDLSLELNKKFSFFLKKSDHKEKIGQTTLKEPYLKVHFFSTTIGNHPAVLIILDNMMEVAQEAQQLKLASLGRFSASIAHELRNPLGTIAHAIQLLGDTSELSSEDVHLKQMIINNCQRMNGVIKNVLQLSRREQAKPQAINLNAFLPQFKRNFSQNNACQFIVKSPKNNKPVLIFDKSQLEQVLVILCENAMQHGRDKEGNVTIKINVSQSARETMLSVCDKGSGIPKEIENEIFEPFFTTVRSGTGMGLFIARDLCEINQARLTLLHGIEEGCCFAIIVNNYNELLI